VTIPDEHQALRHGRQRVEHGKAHDQHKGQPPHALKRSEEAAGLSLLIKQPTLASAGRTVGREFVFRPSQASVG